MSEYLSKIFCNFRIKMKLLFLLLSAQLLINFANGSNPVVLIPGYGASQAFKRVKDSYAHFWLNFLDLFFEDDFAEVFSLQYDQSKKLTYRTPSGLIKFPGWGVPWPSNNLGSFYSYFKYISDMLLKLDYYEYGSTLRAAPYDFRRTIDDNIYFIPSLMSLIEETYELGGKTRVILIAHSMGNIYNHNFLEAMKESWKKKYIETYIAISSPWAGVIKSVHGILRGENLGAPIHETSLRKPIRSFPATHYLYPKKGPYTDDYNFVEVRNGKNYTLANIKEFYDDANFSIGYEMYKDTRPIANTLERPTGVDEIHCIYGNNIPTRNKMLYDSPDDFPDSPPVSLYGNGDGTVETKSLEICSTWEKTTQLMLNDVNHNGILGDERLLKAIKEIMKI